MIIIWWYSIYATLGILTAYAWRKWYNNPIALWIWIVTWLFWPIVWCIAITRAMINWKI